MKKKLQNVAYELMPFSIHNHHFCCHWGRRTTGRCRLCTWYFIEDTDKASYLDFNFTVNKDDLKEFDVYSLIQNSVVGRFRLSIYYIFRQHWLEAAVTTARLSKKYLYRLSRYILFLNVLMRFNSIAWEMWQTLLSIMLILLPVQNKGGGCFFLFLRNTLSLAKYSWKPTTYCWVILLSIIFFRRARPKLIIPAKIL